MRRQWPEWAEDAALEAVAHGVVVDGRRLDNPRTLVPSGSAVALETAGKLQGERKLSWALAHFGVDVGGDVALDVGASTGGFTTALLDAGARRVYALDAGHGQLRGVLRQDSRVVNLERTNVGRLVSEPDLVDDELDVVTVDVSYLSLTNAVAQLRELRVRAGADLLGLVKPMFELRLATIPTDATTLRRAADAAVAGVTTSGWGVERVEECPVRGARGAVEFFLHARRR